MHGRSTDYLCQTPLLNLQMVYLNLRLIIYESIFRNQFKIKSTDHSCLNQLFNNYETKVLSNEFAKPALPQPQKKRGTC